MAKTSKAKAKTAKAPAKSKSVKGTASKQASSKKKASARTPAKHTPAQAASAKQGAKKTAKRTATMKQNPSSTRGSVKQTTASVKKTPAKRATVLTSVKRAPAKKTSAKQAYVNKQATGKSTSVKKAQTKKSSGKAAHPKAEASRKLAAGDRAPAFELSDQNGDRVSSAGLAGKPYVVYFYPKDNTPGCTKESCAFRDLHPAFDKLKVRVFGVSADSEKSHAGFADKFGLPFTLLSDPEKDLISAYGSWILKQNYGREYMGIERSTFLVDKEGVIKNAWRGVKVNGHADAVLEAASALG